MAFSTPQLLKIIKTSYPILENIESLNLLKVGNEGTLYEIVTSKNTKYILKIYKSSCKIKKVLKIEGMCKMSKFPCTETLLSNSLDPALLWNKKTVLYKKFEGDFIDFPQLEDINEIASHLSNLHNFFCVGAPKFKKYWSLLNYSNIYKKYGEFIPKEFVLDMLSINLLNKQDFPTCLLHGDLHKFNILKNEKNEYCFLDLGCSGIGPRILEVVQLVADFLIDTTSLNNTKNRINSFFCFYKPNQSFTFAEKRHFNLLLKNYFCMFIARDIYLLQKNPSNTEANYWYKNALVGLEMSKNLQITF